MLLHPRWDAGIIFLIIFPQLQPISSICSVVLWICHIWMLGMAEGSSNPALEHEAIRNCWPEAKENGQHREGRRRPAPHPTTLRAHVPKQMGSSGPAEIPSPAPNCPQIPGKSRRWESPRKGCSMLSVRQLQPGL